MPDCEHMVNFPRNRERSKYLLVVEHLERDLLSVGVTEKEIQKIKADANGNVIACLRAAYKERLK
jgi:hypothetical protein